MPARQRKSVEANDGSYAGLVLAEFDRQEQDSTELTDEEVEELFGVRNGADVWGYSNAKNLRSIQRKRPELISIVAAMSRPPAIERQPYFGCIATKAGLDFLRAVLDHAAGAD